MLKEILLRDECGPGARHSGDAVDAADADVLCESRALEYLAALWSVRAVQEIANDREQRDSDRLRSYCLAQRILARLAAGDGPDAPRAVFERAVRGTQWAMGSRWRLPPAANDGSEFDFAAVARGNRLSGQAATWAGLVEMLERRAAMKPGGLRRKPGFIDR